MCGTQWESNSLTMIIEHKLLFILYMAMAVSIYREGDHFGFLHV